MADATCNCARDRRWLILGVIGLAQASAGRPGICAATIMVDGYAGVRSASIRTTQSQALPRYPSVAAVADQ